MTLTVAAVDFFVTGNMGWRFDSVQGLRLWRPSAVKSVIATAAGSARKRTSLLPRSDGSKRRMATKSQVYDAPISAIVVRPFRLEIQSDREFDLFCFRPRVAGFSGTVLPYSSHQAVKASMVGASPKALRVISYSTRGGTSA